MPPPAVAAGGGRPSVKTDDNDWIPPPRPGRLRLPPDRCRRRAGDRAGAPSPPAADPTTPAAVPPAATAPAAPLLDGGGSLGLLPPAQRVAFWEKRVADGGSILDLINLADAYLDRSRQAASWMTSSVPPPRSTEAAKTAPYPERVIVRRALVAFALHDFLGARRRADTVLPDSPDDLAALGVAGDARLETGDIAGARERYRRLAELAPSPAAWSRLGRLAFLTGDPDAAARFVSRAAAASRAEGAPDAEAFYDFQLGDLHRATGDLVGAEAAYTASLAALPEYVPAMNGLAAVLAATDRRDEAIHSWSARPPGCRNPSWWPPWATSTHSAVRTAGRRRVQAGRRDRAAVGCHRIGP